MKKMETTIARTQTAFRLSTELLKILKTEARKQNRSLNNWDILTAYFQYSEHIRRIIYTTNTVEGYHRQLRKVSKNKGVFTSDTALEKLVYLAFTRIRKKWTQPVQNWGQTAQQLAILFPDRFKLIG